MNFYDHLNKEFAYSKEAFLYSINRLPSSKIIVINVGFSSLTYNTGLFNIRNLKNFITDVAELINSDSKKRIVIVISDSIKNTKQQYYALQDMTKNKKQQKNKNEYSNKLSGFVPQKTNTNDDSIQEIWTTDSSLYAAMVSMVHSDIVNLFYDGFSGYNLRTIGFSISSNGVDIVGELKRFLKDIEKIAFKSSIKDADKIVAIQSLLHESRNVTQTTGFRAVAKKTAETVKGLFKAYPRTIPIIMEDISQRANSLEDDDGFAAKIATAINADAMVSISRKGMLYTVDPLENNKALPFYCYDTSRNTPFSKTRKNNLSKKLTAAKNINSHKKPIPMLLTSYNSPYTICNIFDSDKISNICVNGEFPSFTIFINTDKIDKYLPIESRRIAGKIFVDKNAADALINKSSLLSVGIILIEGSFDRKTTVAILDEKLVEIGKGVTDFSSEELQQNLELHNSVMVINRNRMRINDNYSRGKT